MPDHAISELPRIALVYGQDAAVEHVRDAVGGHVEVVYAAAAGEFDVARMTDAHATAALVNLDDGDWLGTIETRLHDAGVAVVYNDPEISRGLDGWERARWLRHLVAKLRGSRDVDPPRPHSVESRTSPVTTPEAASETTATPVEAAWAELPLSPEEIETMTVDLVVEPGSVAAANAENTAAASSVPADVMAMDLAVEEAAASATKAGSRGSADVESGPPAMSAASSGTDLDAENGLDVDTETLSAMIDARLAESQATPPSDSPQVWRVASGGAVSPVQLDAPAEPVAAGTASAKPAAAAPAAESAATLQQDADVLASLPSLGDWQLVDPEAPAAKVETGGGKAPEPALLDSFAGLELVPMETIVPAHVHTDPIERWLHADGPTKPLAGGDAVAKADGDDS